MSYIDWSIILNTLIGGAYIALTVVLLPGTKIPIVSGWTSFLLKFATGAFLLACAAHHIHLAQHYAGAPANVPFPEWELHALLFDAVQVVAAPGAVVLAWYLKRTALRQHFSESDHDDIVAIRQGVEEVKEELQGEPSLREMLDEVKKTLAERVDLHMANLKDDVTDTVDTIIEQTEEEGDEPRKER